MTQLSSKIVQCPKCGVENKIMYYASINTFMDLDGALIAKLLNGTLNTFECENCGVNIRLSLDILINCRKGMFYLNPTDDIEYKKEQLISYGLSEKGEIFSGLESQFLLAKSKLEKSKQPKPSPLPPPAPKVSPHTKNYYELSKKLDKTLFKKKKNDEDRPSKTNAKKPEPPPPPPS